MTKRHFPNWIEAYTAYARDEFCPDSFHLWTGLSVLSGALERKVWLQEGHIRHYPNIFILLVANPGIGKSTAIKRGADFLELLKKKDNPDFKIMSGLATQAGLMSEMKTFRMIYEGNQMFPMTSVYYYASEASDSGLQNLSGDFNATITALYDCDDQYRKRLKNEEYTFPRPSMAVIAGSTFDFLKNLVNQNSVMGGLASRFLYIIAKEKREQKAIWGSPLKGRDHETEKKLYEDLLCIHRLSGAFCMEPAALDLYLDWFSDFDKRYRKIESERMLSILTRVPTALKKVLMLVSVSEHNDLGISLGNMQRAIELVEEATKDNAMIISQAIIGNKNTQESVNQFILQAIKKHGNGSGLLLSQLRSHYISYGGDVGKFDPTRTMLEASGYIDVKVENGDFRLTLLKDPDLSL